MTEYEMVGWHHGLNEHESDQTLGDGEGQGSLECFSPWGHIESDMTECLNKNNFIRAVTKVLTMHKDSLEDRGTD